MGVATLKTSYGERRLNRATVVYGGGLPEADKPPVSPHPDNDEFEGPTLDPSWTSSFGTGEVDLVFKNSRLQIKMNTTGTFPMCYLKKAVPVTNFSFRVKTSWEGQAEGDMGHSGASLWLADGRILRFAFLRLANNVVIVSTYTINSDGTYNGSLGFHQTFYTGTSGYGEIAYNVSTQVATIRFSNKGEDYGFYKSFTLSSPATHYGAVLGPNNAIVGLPFMMEIDFFRVSMPS